MVGIIILGILIGVGIISLGIFVAKKLEFENFGVASVYLNAISSFCIMIPFVIAGVFVIGMSGYIGVQAVSCDIVEREITNLVKDNSVKDKFLVVDNDNNAYIVNSENKVIYEIDYGKNNKSELFPIKEVKVLDKDRVFFKDKATSIDGHIFKRGGSFNRLFADMPLSFKNNCTELSEN